MMSHHKACHHRRVYESKDQAKQSARRASLGKLSVKLCSKCYAWYLEVQKSVRHQ